MALNPFEIRLETLKMSKEMLDQKFQVQLELMHRMIDQAAEVNGDAKAPLISVAI